MSDQPFNPVRANTVMTRYGKHVEAGTDGDVEIPVAFLTIDTGEGEPITYAFEAVQAIRMAKDLLEHLG